MFSACFKPSSEPSFGLPLGRSRGLAPRRQPTPESAISQIKSVAESKMRLEKALAEMSVSRQLNSAAVGLGETPVKAGIPSETSPSKSGSSTAKRAEYLGWEDYFMAVACLSAQRSKDPNTQVLALLLLAGGKRGQWDWRWVLAS